MNPAAPVVELAITQDSAGLPNDDDNVSGI
jgi:hypothetical protein